MKSHHLSIFWHFLPISPCIPNMCSWLVLAPNLGSEGWSFAIIMQVACQNVAAYRETLGNPQINLEFVQGQIEDLSGAGIRKEAFDLVISNCVVNLSPDKPKVLSEVYRALKKGGEFYFSDVYCDTRLSKDVQSNKVIRRLHSKSLSGLFPQSKALGQPNS